MAEPIDVTRRFVTQYQAQHDKPALEELVAPDFLDHTPFPGFAKTRSGLGDLFDMLWMAFPDLKPEILHQYSQEDRVATVKVFNGTHLGPFFGIPATGKPVGVMVVDIVRVENGQIVEHWNVVDQAGLMRQLGAA